MGVPAFLDALIDLGLVVELGFLVRMGSTSLELGLKLGVDFKNILASALFHDELVAPDVNQIIIVHPLLALLFSFIGASIHLGCGLGPGILRWINLLARRVFSWFAIYFLNQNALPQLVLEVVGPGAPRFERILLG